MLQVTGTRRVVIYIFGTITLTRAKRLLKNVQMDIKPLFDRVVLKIEKEQTTNVGGIFLPDRAAEKSQIATVVAVGKGGNVDGKDIKMEVAVGDRVLFSKFAGTEFKYKGEDLLIIKQTDILAIIEKGVQNG